VLWNWEERESSLFKKGFWEAKEWRSLEQLSTALEMDVGSCGGEKLEMGDLRKGNANGDWELPQQNETFFFVSVSVVDDESQPFITAIFYSVRMNSTELRQDNGSCNEIDNLNKITDKPHHSCIFERGLF
jgi:hypothetical protein